MSENKGKIEDLKRKLYDPNYDESTSYRRGALREQRHDVKDEWDKPKDEEMYNKKQTIKSSFFKKFFILSIIFFIGAVGYSVYNFFSNDSTVSGNKINLEIIGSSFTKGGEDLPLQIEITNRNSANLESATLIIEYPKGANDDSEMIRLDRDEIGTIKPGETVIRNIRVKLYGSEKSIKNIKVNLEYRPEGSNAIFTKEKYYPVTISLAPVSLKIEAPNSVIANQTIAMKITTTLNTTQPDGHLVLQLKHPNNFMLETANPLPMNDNYIWDLSSISQTTPITIELKGKLMGQTGDEQVFHAYAGTLDNNDSSKVGVVYSSILQKMIIENPFLDIKVLVNNQDQEEYAVKGGQEVSVDITWENNLPSSINDAEIIAKITGNILDKNKIKESAGYYDSLNEQIIWNKSTMNGLASIEPGGTGKVSFDFTPMNLTSLSGVKNPQATISVSIKGNQPLYGSSFSNIDNFTEKKIKLQTDFQVASSLSYLSGDLPPKAEGNTNYMVTWTLSNTTNNVSQALVVATLPIYTDWIGFVAGTKENISYNKENRQITWKIGSVLPGTGVDSNREVSFIVNFKPSLSQVGLSPILIQGISLTGTDSYSGAQVGSTMNNLYISSISGVSAGGESGKVSN
jgi:hypothetical protein